MIRIDQQRCTACGLCGKICPRYVLETVEGDGKRTTRVVEEREPICIRCGHCMAICATGSIRVDGIDPTDLVPPPAETATPEQLLGLLGRRRTVRRYKDQPVPRETIDRLLEAARWTPSASSSGAVGVIVIDKPEPLRQLSAHIYDLYQKLDGALRHAIPRFFVRRQLGAAKLAALESFVLPGHRWYARWFREGRSNELVRDAPAVLLFHAPMAEPSGDESCLLAAWDVALLAETMGLGACVNGLVPPGCNRSPAARALLGLPADREVYASLTLGYPKYRFKHTLRRRAGEIRYLEPARPAAP
jgi:nitroreductase/NAD-dependent dihydropyrimidine dehydrogenase PreA subunit